MGSFGYDANCNEVCVHSPTSRLTGPFPHLIHVRKRFVVGLALSLLLHFAVGVATSQGWLAWLPWFGKRDEAITVLRVQIRPAPAPVRAAEPPKTEPPPVVAAAPPAAPPKPPRRKPKPVEKPVLIAPAPPEDTPPAAGVVAARESTPVPEPVPAADAAAAATPVVTEQPQEASAAAKAPPRPRQSPFPQRARIAFEMTLESNNYKVWAEQLWEDNDLRYKISFQAKARVLFFTAGSINMTSRGRITPIGLVPDSYEHQQNQRSSSVSFNPSAKTAQVVETSGNQKTVELQGQATDLMSLTYELGFDPDVAVGTPFTLFNRDNLEELVLTEKRSEILETDAGRLNTMMFDLKRSSGTGGATVWLAVDRQWLPAKIRFIGRDGAVTMLATKIEINPPQ